MKLTLHEVAHVVGATNDLSDVEDVPLHQIEFDSRKIGPGDLFLPLKGARDGHDFIETAFANGAIATFTEKVLETDKPYLLVEDALKAFQDLAAYYLERTGVDVIAVTGSNGKTTTKDMIYDILSTTYKTYKTQGNYNNEIGLPYTALHMPDDTEKIVLEMGQDHLGDIKLLSEIAKPRIAVVTLIGEAHLEFFGSRDKIAEGKMQILDGMGEDGILIAPADVIIEPFIPEDQMVIRFGDMAELHLIDLVEEKDSLSFKPNFMDRTISLPVPGKYNATNALVAAYVGRLSAVEDEGIVEALAHLNLTRNRTEWKKAANGADILSDVYNANPTAMRLILETFSAIPRNAGGQKIAVLADMKELGDTKDQLHVAMIDSLDPAVLDAVYLYGPDIQPLYEKALEKFPSGSVSYFTKTDEMDQLDALIIAIKASLKPTDQILLKGSNSMNLAKVVEELEHI
ncbi:UDP-N-acetylmuramoyl-tripeptide--D-alanyl-D-alanine ligase [Streptococcus caprae]|uniref:UDP-N-acetylmuramoyl-tripeptide--D-alanyl-D-alanine ligase n=1 Tax=Streptococcus caprae TaxID=1640501 RepID=A0ABV8CTZ4_9STRE